MGRPTINVAPQDGGATHACARCGRSGLAADEFYWRADGRRRDCKECHRSWEAQGTFTVRNCAVCAESFTPTHPRHIYCSTECKIAARRLAANEKYRAAHPLEPRGCRNCAVEFEPVDGAQRFCSNRCLQQFHSGVHRARELAATVVPFSRVYIIERDRSRCHLCGKRCEPGEIHLDHLVPLSLGGAHAPENVRVACAACNLSKKASARDEQLLLIG